MISTKKPKVFSAKFISTGIYFVHKGKVLFLKRKDRNSQRWGTPGGTINDGESAIQTIIREVSEEIGWDIERKRIIPLHKFYVTYPRYQYIYHTFRCDLEKKQRIKLNHEHSEYRWLTPEQGMRLHLIIDEDYCIKRAFGIK